MTADFRGRKKSGAREKIGYHEEQEQEQKKQQINSARACKQTFTSADAAVEVARVEIVKQQQKKSSKESVSI